MLVRRLESKQEDRHIQENATGNGHNPSPSLKSKHGEEKGRVLDELRERKDV